MKKIYLILLTLCGSNFVKAQTTFGVQAGILNSKVKIEEGNETYPGAKSSVGFRIGAFAEIPVSGNFYFSPGLNFVAKGGKFKTTETNSILGNTFINTSEEDYKTNYLELPLNFTYKLNQEGGLFFGAGPVIGLGIGGKAKSSLNVTRNGSVISAEEASADVKFDGKENATGDDLHLKALEFGANAFVGYALKNGFRAQLSFNPAFSNISPESNFSYKNTYYLGLTIGYTFSTKTKK